MPKKTGLIVLDFDDTLFFVQRSIKIATKKLLNRTDLNKEDIRRLPKKIKGRLYELAYSKYKNYSKPNLLLIKRLEKLRKDNKIIVLTARGNNLSKDTFQLIRKHSILIDRVYHRKDVNSEDELWKMKRLKNYSKFYRHVSLYEDKMENINFIRKALGSKKISYYYVTKKSIKKV